MAVEDEFYNFPMRETSVMESALNRPDVEQYSILADELRDRIDGDVRFDEYA